MYKILFLISILILIPKENYASPPPVTHSHNGKTHTHILPNNGVGRHNHTPSPKKIGKAINNKKQHNINKKENYKKWSTPKPSKEWVRDQSGCLNFPYRDMSSGSVFRNIDSSWTGKCLNGYAEGVGTLSWHAASINISYDIRYVGAMKKGKMHGKGTILYGDTRGNSILEGTWVNGKSHGKEIHKRRDNTAKISMYKNGIIYGKVVSIDKDGKRTYELNYHDYLINNGYIINKDGDYVEKNDKKENRQIAGGGGIFEVLFNATANVLCPDKRKCADAMKNIGTATLNINIYKQGIIFKTPIKNLNLTIKGSNYFNKTIKTDGDGIFTSPGRAKLSYLHSGKYIISSPYIKENIEVYLSKDEYKSVNIELK